MSRRKYTVEEAVGLIQADSDSGSEPESSSDDEYLADNEPGNDFASQNSDIDSSEEADPPQIYRSQPLRVEVGLGVDLVYYIFLKLSMFSINFCKTRKS